MPARKLSPAGHTVLKSQQCPSFSWSTKAAYYAAMVANAWPRQLNEYLSGAVAHGPSFSQPSHLRQLGGETSSSSAPIVQLWLANCHWPERRTGCRRIPAGVRLCLASRPGFEGPTSMRVVMAIACKNTIEHKKGGKRCHDPFSMRRPDNKKREPLPAVRPEINAAPLAQPNAEFSINKAKAPMWQGGQNGVCRKIPCTSCTRPTASRPDLCQAATINLNSFKSR